jgi:gamma-glutamylaminecyclotransferase
MKRNSAIASHEVDHIDFTNDAAPSIHRTLRDEAASLKSNDKYHAMPHMQFLFVYGSLKQGFANEHVNGGTRLPGKYQTRVLLPMYLLGDGQVPCIIHTPGSGYHVIGEVYQVSQQSLANMDGLERLGEPGGYERVEIEVESVASSVPSALAVFVYVKADAQVPASTQRIGPLAEYTQAHAHHFDW